MRRLLRYNSILGVLTICRFGVSFCCIEVSYSISLPGPQSKESASPSLAVNVIGEKLFSTNGDVILPFPSSRGEEFSWDCWVLYNPV